MNDEFPRVAVINVVALSQRTLAQMPQLNKWAQSQQCSSFKPAFPAVTCTAQATYVTGLLPEFHGILGNGWYNRTMAEVQFWKQSDKLVHGEKIWETLKKQLGNRFTCAKLFWWYNMYSQVNWSMTPRPMYPADGRKIFNIYTQPMDLANVVQHDLGNFPFPYFWGPAAGAPSSRWIVQAARWTEEKYKPSLSLVYLPHLDYDLQRFGPEDPRSKPALEEADNLAMELVYFYQQRGVIPLVVSEYGITPAKRNLALNRIFRSKGWISIRRELGHDMLDCGASRVFAVADHQTAHIYLNDLTLKNEVLRLLDNEPMIAELRVANLDSLPPTTAERCADIIAVAQPDAWFSYYFWDDDKNAPDFARCIDIHRKPGYDPAELFIDPTLKLPQFRIAQFLLKKKLGFRALMEIVPLNGDLVRGSHGSDLVDEMDQPMCIAPPGTPTISAATNVRDCILSLFGLSAPIGDK